MAPHILQWRLLLLLLVPCVDLPTSLGIKWENCAPASAPVHIEQVSMSPDPAVSGEDFTLTLPATTDQQLQGGNVRVFVAYYGIPVYISNEDLCVRTPCPVRVGNFTFTNSQPLPSVTPAGSYTLWLTATAVPSAQVLFCTKVSFRIVRPASVGRRMVQ